MSLWLKTVVTIFTVEPLLPVHLIVDRDTKEGQSSNLTKSSNIHRYSSSLVSCRLEKEEVRELLQYIDQFNIEVISEIPSLTHAYYLLFGHKNNAEIVNAEYPDIYCPLKPENYKIYFDVLDEYIDVFHPKIIHVGHDEWRMESLVQKWQEKLRL